MVWVEYQRSMVETFIREIHSGPGYFSVDVDAKFLKNTSGLSVRTKLLFFHIHYERPEQVIPVAVFPPISVHQSPDVMRVSSKDYRIPPIHIQIKLWERDLFTDHFGWCPEGKQRITDAVRPPRVRDGYPC